MNCSARKYGTEKSTCCLRSSVMVMPSMPTSNWPSRTAEIMVSQAVTFQLTWQLSRRQISFTASYSHPTASPVAGSTKFSGV
jgi:hypothetical protein